MVGSYRGARNDFAETRQVRGKVKEDGFSSTTEQEGKKMSKRLLPIILLMAFILSCPVNTIAKPKPFKIGVVYGLSGALATFSEPMVIGHRIAAKEIMREGGFLGREVEFIVRDDASNPELTTRYCRELITKDEVDWIVGTLGSNGGLAASPVAKEFKTPIFLWDGKSERITVEDWHPYIFRYNVPVTCEARAGAEVLAKEVLKGVSNPKVYWISWDYEYGRTLYTPFAAKLKELIPGVQIAGEAWPRTGETDYGPFISHMLVTKPQVVVSAIWGGGIVSFTKQAKGVGLWDLSTLMTMGEIGSIDYRKGFGLDMPEGTWGNTMDDVVWPNNEAQRKYYQAYQDFSGKKDQPGGYSVVGYNMIRLIDAAMRKAKKADKEAVIKAMEGLTINTFQGPITVRDFDHQVMSGQYWAPMIKKEGLPYLELDGKRGRWVPTAKDAYTKEEWLSRRKAAGK